MEFVVSSVVAKLSIKCPFRVTNGASTYRWVGGKKALLAKFSCWGETCFFCDAKGSAANASETFKCWHFSCLFTFLPSSVHRLRDNREPRLHPSGFCSPVVPLQVFCGLLSPHSRSNVCLRRPTRQHNVPLANAKYQSPICLRLADREKGLGGFIW